jgi:RimJ/RimL family protein N-acetyltransferase
VIETERLVLRRPRLDDAEALLEFVGDEEVMRRIGDEPGGREKAEAFVARWINRWERNGVGQFIVELDRNLIGRVGLIVWDRRTWETSAYDLAGSTRRRNSAGRSCEAPGATATRRRRRRRSRVGATRIAA